MRARLGTTLLLAATLSLAPSLALGQNPQDAKAKTLLDKGKEHLKAGRAKEACEVLDQSIAIEQAINTHYQLGKCHEALGHYATAHAAFLRAATMANTAGDKDRFDAAQKAADELKAKIASAVIVVPTENRPTGLVVTRDGEEIPDSEWGKATPLDPGEHVFTAKAPGYEPWEQKILTPATGGVTQVAVPVLAREGEAKPDGEGAASPPEEGADWPRRSSGLFGMGIAFTCVGGLAILVGGAGTAFAATCEGLACPKVGPWAAGALIGVGLLAAGIPITAVFGAHVPPEGTPVEGTPAEPTATEQSEASQSAWLLTPMVSPFGGGLRLDF